MKRYLFAGGFAVAMILSYSWLNASANPANGGLMISRQSLTDTTPRSRDTMKKKKYMGKDSINRKDTNWHNGRDSMNMRDTSWHNGRDNMNMRDTSWHKRRDSMNRKDTSWPMKRDSMNRKDSRPIKDTSNR